MVYLMGVLQPRALASISSAKSSGQGAFTVPSRFEGKREI